MHQMRRWSPNPSIRVRGPVAELDLYQVRRAVDDPAAAPVDDAAAESVDDAKSAATDDAKSEDEADPGADAPRRHLLRGLGIRAGVTLIVGGGYHGKSTLLRALERSIHPHIPGDGREGRPDGGRDGERV